MQRLRTRHYFIFNLMSANVRVAQSGQVALISVNVAIEPTGALFISWSTSFVRKIPFTGIVAEPVGVVILKV
jgi:hypothetical protein